MNTVLLLVNGLTLFFMFLLTFRQTPFGRNLRNRLGMDTPWRTWRIRAAFLAGGALAVVLALWR